MPRLFPLVLALLLGCTASTVAGPTPSLVPTTYYAWTPPEHFEDWYHEAATCAFVLPGDFSLIQWFVVPGGLGWNLTEDGNITLGLYVSPHDIYLAEIFMLEAWLVKHEMLHALGFLGHPEPPFGVCELQP